MAVGGCDVRERAASRRAGGPPGRVPGGRQGLGCQPSCRPETASPGRWTGRIHGSETHC